VARVIPIEDLRRSPSAVLFEGGDDVALSVFVPALMPHAFKGAGDGTLRVVSIHPSGTTQQTAWVSSP